MVLTMAPTVAFAADATSDPAAQSNPVAQIKGAQKSSVYFGHTKRGQLQTQSSDGNGDYLTEPIKWRVRHTFATLSLKYGVDVKTLSGALGDHPL